VAGAGVVCVGQFLLNAGTITKRISFLVPGSISFNSLNFLAVLVFCHVALLALHVVEV